MRRPREAPPLADLFVQLAAEPDQAMERWRRIAEARIGVAPGGKYRHWDNLRYLSPPDGLSLEEWWLGIKNARRPGLRPLPLRDAEGRQFEYSTPDEALELLHQIDQRASGEISMQEVVTADHAAQQRYLVNSLIEEAVRSSQLEGANTTRRAAKDMILSGRPPQDRSERMILNNFRALQFIRENAQAALSPVFILELHGVLTEGTLDDPESAGRLQRPDDQRVVVWNEHMDEIAHEPPPAEQLEGRLASMCHFANRTEQPVGFVHPVVRAVLLHFWLAYDHPFEDGNGRTARAVFYWSMLSQGYWLTEYLSISGILRKAPAQYARSFLYTETDERDTTYFLLYQLHVICRAIDELHLYLRRKIGEVREIEHVIKRSDEFNYRQLALLGNALRHPDERYSFLSHARSHNVSQQSARNDLLGLFERSLLVRRRSGHKYIFSPAPDLPDRLRQ